MRKIIAYIAMSLDGYVADENGNVSWLSGDGTDSENFGSYPEFIETIDTVILGYNTYYQIITELSPDVWAYEGKTSYVLTHRDIDDKEGIFFTSKNINELVSELKSKSGKDIWICGGAGIINQFHDENLIDEYIISVIPVILGKGIKLFNTNITETKLVLKSTKSYNGIVDLRYTKRKQEGV